VAGDPVGIFLSSSLVALGVRFFWSTVFTAIADFADGSTSSMSKDVWFAWASMARTAGFSIGSLITAAAISFANEAAYKALTVGAAVSFLVAGMVIGFRVRAPRRAHDTGEDGAAAGGYRGMLRDGPFLSYTGINAIFATTMTMLALGLPIFMADGLQGPSWLAPTLLAANTIALSLLTAPVAKRLAPYRRTRVLMAAAMLWTLWAFLFALLPPGRGLGVILALIAATALFTCAELIHAPVSMAPATAMSPTASRGRYLASFQYSFLVANMLGPALFTVLFNVFSWLPWLLLGVSNLLMLLAMRLLERAIPESAQGSAGKRSRTPSCSHREVADAVRPDVQ
jgi:Na+/melibiose symporter-like transporter